eukprot:TRINITY_DN387_c0_g1_i6.p1 TRINITY_DN387_c0_g1~~TRINITY_DN387_c0_g1_i6.p1  ORF type:complete len:193 (-),score=67.39 TRINITY_DN387_c0_g1_i6:79-657(-)
MASKVLKTIRVFDGRLVKMQHVSAACKCDMTYSIWLPEEKPAKPVPLIYWLSGLTCTDDNFTQKAGAFKALKQRGVGIVCPDTSPRQPETIEGEADSYDFGTGAGFYVNATVPAWSDQGYHMYDYITQELPEQIRTEFGTEVDVDNSSIMGHSMGCLLYTSDAADEEDSVDLGGRRIIKKKKKKKKEANIKY